MERRKTRLGSNKKRLSDAPSRDLWPRDRSSGDLAALRHDGFPSLACPRPATSVAVPRIGPGRQPLSLRVCACEAQPRTPHPTGSGYPSPAKLALCPTSVTPLEAPLTGQDTSRISEVLRPWIGIHSQVRERRAAQTFVPRTQRSVEHLRSGALQSHKRVYARLRRAMVPVTCDLKKPGSRFCEAALRKCYALHRARDTRAVFGLRLTRGRQ
jgi:hypothetical protein